MPVPEYSARGGLVVDWDALAGNREIRVHVWKVLRERVLEWEVVNRNYYYNREGKLQADIEFRPFQDEGDAFFLFKLWDDCLQLYRLNADEWLVTITCSTKAIPGSVGGRGPTVSEAMFRATVQYLHKKHIKWRPGI